VTEHPVVPAAACKEAKCEAIELFRTTNLTVSSIATQVGASRGSVYRWLRREGIPLGRNANHGSVTPVPEILTRISEDVAELRREMTSLTAQVGRLAGVIEVFVAPRPQAASPTIHEIGGAA
jgi:transposase-like protein